MTFQEKLIILRKNNRLTQDDLAKAVGVSRQAVYKWENGTSYPEIQKLIEMRELFNISLDNLFDDTYEIEVPEKKKRRRSASPKAAAPAAEVAPVVESAPAVEEVPVVESAPAVEEVPVVESAPAVEATPVVEEAPAVEAAPVIEEKPAVEEAPAVKKPEKKVAHIAAVKIEDLKDEELDGLKRIDVPVPEEENKEEEIEAPQEKKVGFFGRLFGRR